MSILINNLTFSYPEAPEHAVLSIKHWLINTGDQIFLHGASGTGKTTLLNLLSGVLTCKKGEISILDQRLDQMSRHQRDKFRANHIGYVFQQFNLIPYLNVIENIKLAAHFSNSNKKNAALIDKIEATLTALNIETTLWHKPTAQLSIGQQQRVAITRALINQPEILIVDEPTSSLDRKNRDDFMSLVMPLVTKHKITLIFVSHDISLGDYFSRHESLAEINQSIEADIC